MSVRDVRDFRGTAIIVMKKLLVRITTVKRPLLVKLKRHLIKSCQLFACYDLRRQADREPARIHT